MSTALTHIAAKLERADQHIVQLGTEAEAFSNETPHRELIDYDAEAAKAFKAFHLNRVVPARLSILTGEAIYQMRSSLDHLACALILKDGGTVTDGSQFPIFRFEPVKPENLGRYKRQIEGITRPAVLAAIEALQPHTRGDGRDFHWLQILKVLSNLDKHKTLITHVSVVQPRISHTSIFNNDTSLMVESDAIDHGTEIVTAGRHRIFGDEVEVVNVQRRLTTFVSFDWPGAPYDLFAVYALRGLHTAVSDVVKEFSPFLA